MNWMLWFNLKSYFPKGMFKVNYSNVIKTEKYSRQKYQNKHRYVKLKPT